jgi:hypothetical protein
MTVLLIGSGLSAYGAARALESEGIKFDVIDVGKNSPISFDDKEVLSGLFTVDKDRFYNQLIFENVKFAIKSPQKHSFGSDYFYENEIKVLNKKGNFFGYHMPETNAFGGFGTAWAGSILIPTREDIGESFEGYEELLASIRECFAKIDISEPTDNIDDIFPRIKKSTPDILELSKSQKSILLKLKRIEKRGRYKLLVGQSRLATSSKNGKQKCVKCGLCNTGCFAGSIFSPENYFTNLFSSNRAKKLFGRKVLRVGEDHLNSWVEFFNYEKNIIEKKHYDRIIMAAGAVATTRIVLNSLNKETIQSTKIAKTGGFILPIFSIKSFKSEWPNVNTQPTIFLEVMNEKISKRWVHVQISTSNENVLNMFPKMISRSKLFPFLQKYIMNHFIFALANLHSDEGAYFDIRMKSESEFDAIMDFSRKKEQTERKAIRFLSIRFLRVGLIPVYFAKISSSKFQTYHTGGSFPMSDSRNQNTTDELGRLTAFKNIHLVDGSILGVIPGTTIGTLLMGNSHRITNRIIKTLEVN